MNQILGGSRGIFGGKSGDEIQYVGCRFGTLANLHRNHLRSATRALDGLDSVFRCKFSHEECELAVARHYDGSAIKPAYVLLAATTANFDHEFGICHRLYLPPRRKFLGSLMMVSAGLEQRSLLLRVSAEFFHFVYSSFLIPGCFAQTLTLGLIALLLLALLFLLAFVESGSASWHMVPSLPCGFYLRALNYQRGSRG
jgi:hypothetical protein